VDWALRSGVEGGWWKGKMVVGGRKAAAVKAISLIIVRGPLLLVHNKVPKALRAKNPL
jgi:hypothetical protein